MRSSSKALFALLLAAPARAAGPALLPEPALEIRDRHGALLRTVLSADERLQLPVPLEEVSPWAVLATLAAEDGRFFSHKGVDPRSVARALWQNASAGRTVSGGSTLTQQLVRTLEPRPRTLAGKVREAARALLLERRRSKRDILEAYLNQVPYGHLTQGIEAAARAYFGVSSRDLSLAQAAALAAIPKSPVKYDPVRRWPAVRERQRTVLARMRRWGWIGAEAHALALAEEPLVLAPRRALLAPHFTEAARRRAGPGPVATTLDLGLQQRLEEALSAQLARLKAHRVGNGAIVVLDNRDGEVLAWVGSASFSDERSRGQVDGVLAARQPGSAVKPFAYGLALSRGLKASDLLDDSPLAAPGGFTPKNYDEAFHGPVRAREALACSYNVPAVRLAERFGVRPILEALRAFGLESLDRPAEHYGLGLVLGNGEVTLLELASAYSALARGGVRLEPRLLQGAPREPARRVLDAESAYLVTSILSDNAARAEAFGLNSPLALPFPFAAKTGTTKDYRDNWALGYTPEWTVGVWVGNFDGEPMRRVSGITGAAPVLRDAALAVHERYPSSPFPVPPGIREVEVCPLSGQVPGPFCPERMREVFSRKSLPEGVCPLHRAPESPAAPSPLSIDFPAPGEVLKLDAATPRAAQVLRLRAKGEASGELVWRVDGRELRERGPAAWWPLSPGRHKAELLVLDGASPRKAGESRFLVLPP